MTFNPKALWQSFPTWFQAVAIAALGYVAITAVVHSILDHQALNIQSGYGHVFTTEVLDVARKRKAAADAAKAAVKPPDAPAPGSAK